jgi:hypothetical protein
MANVHPMLELNKTYVRPKPVSSSQVNINAAFFGAKM